jgi:triacylglycerol lipase
MSLSPGFRRYFLLAPIFALSLASPLRAVDLEELGFPTRFAEIIELEELNREVRFDSAAAMEAETASSFERVTVVELPSVRSRYALFENGRSGEAVVAIRGTVNLENAASDLEFLKKRSPELGISLHSGFEEVALALYADLKPRIGKDWSLRVTGHSLGAAEAVILGMLLSRDGYKVDLVLASAPPKVTDAEGWERFASLPVVRLAAPYDPVPFLPPRSLFYSRDPYIQGGPLLFILDGSRFSVVDSSWYDDFPDAERAAVSDRRSFAVADHLLSTYLARLLPKARGSEYVEPAQWQRFALPARRGAHYLGPNEIIGKGP